MRSSDDGRFVVFLPGTAGLRLFDTAGQQLAQVRLDRVMGKDSASIGDAQFVSDGILVLDLNLLRLLLVRDNVVAAVSDQSVLPGRFRIIGDSIALIGAIDRSPRLVGFPLHAVDRRSGNAIAHFGMTDGRWSIAAPYATDVVLGKTASSDAVWKGDRMQLRFEEWASAGTRLRTVELPHNLLPGLPRRNDNRRPTDGRPATTLIDFAVDNDEKLWMIHHVADARWRQVTLHGKEKYVLPEDLVRYVDSRIDVVDLRTMRHLGYSILNEHNAGLLLRRGSANVYREVIRSRQPVVEVLRLLH